MKPEEAILMMRNRIDTASEIAGKGTDGKAFEDMEMAIEALKEIQQYREIGTVKECREAMEKQKPQKPKDSLKIKPVIDCNGAYVDADTTVYLLCPNCGEMVGIDERIDSFCRECGQAIMQEGDEA